MGPSQVPPWGGGGGWWRPAPGHFGLYLLALRLEGTSTHAILLVTSSPLSQTRPCLVPYRAQLQFLQAGPFGHCLPLLAQPGSSQPQSPLPILSLLDLLTLSWDNATLHGSQPMPHSLGTSHFCPQSVPKASPPIPGLQVNAVSNKH